MLPCLKIASASSRFSGLIRTEIPHFLHSAEDVIHVADCTDLELFLESVEVQAGSAYEDLSALLDKSVQILNDLRLNSCNELNAFVHEQNVCRDPVRLAQCENSHFCKISAELGTVGSDSIGVEEYGICISLCYLCAHFGLAVSEFYKELVSAWFACCRSSESVAESCKVVDLSLTVNDDLNVLIACLKFLLSHDYRDRALLAASIDSHK